MNKRNPRHLRIWIPDPRTVDRLGTIQKGQSTMKIPASWRALWYVILLSAMTLVTVLYTLTWARGTTLRDYGFNLGSGWHKPNSGKNATVVSGSVEAGLPPGMHPIEHLMKLAKKRMEKVERNGIHSLEQAAAQYRKLRGRHPPPGFEEWYKYADSHNAIINERFWDQIYHDLAPFWSLDPTTLREQAHIFSPKIEVRDGKIESKSYNEDGKMAMWKDLLIALAKDPQMKLPDIDIPLNINEEPAMLVPWETIDTAMSSVRKMMLEPKDTTIKFSGLEDIENLTVDYDWKPEWLGPRLTHPASHLGPRPLWSLIRPACGPDTPVRLGKVYDDIWDPEGETREEHSATALLPHDLYEGTLNGYRMNWTRSIDACEAPNLQGLHSAFVAPKQMGVATKLFPLFGDTKFSMSNEILLPGAADWNTSSPSTDGTTLSWDERENKLFWRGLAPAARDPKRFWQRFQNERLVSMMNATHVEIAEASVHTGNESTVGVGYARNFRLLPANQYHLKTQTGGKLAEWVNSWADVFLESLGCEEEAEGCEYIQEYFSPATRSELAQGSKAKYAISIDSPTSSLVSHLRDGQVTLHASIYRNWYDSRLIPWLHFVPMDNTFVDLYGIMEYFLGSRVPEGIPDFAHAVGEVQKHEHHFKTPENTIEHTSKHFEHGSSSQSGNEPHISPPKRAPNDDAAHQIASAGQIWAQKVLRREDMLIYVYRLLLEYARVVDTKRDRLGWVGDLG